MLTLRHLVQPTMHVWQSVGMSTTVQIITSVMIPRPVTQSFYKDHPVHGTGKTIWGQFINTNLPGATLGRHRHSHEIAAGVVLELRFGWSKATGAGTGFGLKMWSPIDQAQGRAIFST